MRDLPHGLLLGMEVATVTIYVLLGLALGWAAFFHRREGWTSGLLFAALMVAMPLWVPILYWLTQKAGMIADPTIAWPPGIPAAQGSFHLLSLL
jgi:hypothetical protein